MPLAAFPQAPQAPQASTRDSSLALRPYFQQQVNYSLDVSLDATDRSLDGFARIQYINRSPDTLSFIWFQLWPNAYKNDQTAFSEQLIGNGRTDFYFSEKEQRGYINRLDLRADGIIARTEDHPQYIDVIKVILPRPLVPGAQTEITTPFHVQLPVDFSRGGYAYKSFLAAGWFPQPAVYDRRGWHPLPYLDQGGSYSEFGNFDVRVTLPANYTVVSSGRLITPAPVPPHTPGLPPSPGVRTLQYRQDNIRDFAWFATKDYSVDHDTLLLPSGKVIDLYACYRPADAALWKDAIKDSKYALLFRSKTIGEYPFPAFSVVEAGTTVASAADYPALISIPVSSMKTMTLITDRNGKQPHSARRVLLPEVVDSFRQAISHEAGQEWFSSILGADERSQPWMGDGFSAYYDMISPHTGEFWSYDDYTITKTPGNPQAWKVDIAAAEKKDQPISTSSEEFTGRNYTLIGQLKTSGWLQRLQGLLGKDAFDSCMRRYFRLWQFRHPDPADFRSVCETTAGMRPDPLQERQLDSLFDALDKKGALAPLPAHRIIKAAAVYSHRQTDKYNYINIGPALGYNHYDQFMIGIYVHNFDLPPNRFQFLAAPLIGPHSNRLNGLGGLSYSWYPEGDLRRVMIGLTGSKFSSSSGIDSNGKKIFGGFYKLVPTARLTFRKPSPRSKLERWIEWKTYFIGEKGFDNYIQKSTDSLYYPVLGKYDFRYLNQLSFYLEDQRVLYPYNALLQFQQASDWYRINFTGNYFFNYQGGGGLNLRLFAAKFGYIGSRDQHVDLSLYQPKLTGLTGNEDYTYSNYFVGRDEFTGLASQQIMIRDGGLKIRTDLFQGLQGRSDNWIAAINLNSSLPPGLLPAAIPLKVFFDLGTYSEAWQDDPPTSRFLYVAGLQVTLLRYLTIYAPLFYSNDFGSQLKTVPEQNGFFKKISFSIDFQTLSFGKKGPDNPF